MARLLQYAYNAICFGYIRETRAIPSERISLCNVHTINTVSVHTVQRRGCMRFVRDATGGRRVELERRRGTPVFAGSDKAAARVTL